MHSQRLRDDVWLQLHHDDTTLFGSLCSGELEARLSERMEPLIGACNQAGWEGADPAQVCRQMRAATAAWYVDARTLRSEFLYPDPRRVRPCALSVHTADALLGHVSLSPSMVGQLAPLLGEWQVGGVRPQSGAAAALHDALACLGAFTQAPALPPCGEPGATWVGHAGVRVASAQRRVWVDPFLPAHDPHSAYRPLSLSQLAPTAVLITQSHPDHFDLGTLLRLGADCDIVVPCVPRESALSIDMAARLRQLGFRRVHELRWHDTLRWGDVEVRALPFHGGQPGDGERLHPTLRNLGNLYTVQTPQGKVALSANAGRDTEGDLRQVAAQDAQVHGPADLLFAGCRAWSLYPAQLLRSSVRRHALFIPPSAWLRRHRLMAGAHDTLDAAEAWGATTLIPCADGGAPWYWHQGLGPDLSVPDRGDDPLARLPQAVVHAAGHRSTWGDTSIASPVRVQVLRPGEHRPTLAGSSQGMALTEAQRWPYARVDVTHPVLSATPEDMALGRKKALLRVLAGELATQRGIEVGPAEVQVLSNHLRRVAGLGRHEDMLAWLERSQLSVAQFTELMQEWARCNALETLYAQEIERRLPGQLALHALGQAAARAQARA
ncbi:MAG: MBL fold metallo-hydrolase [Pseudomonadota bacterium]